VIKISLFFPCPSKEPQAGAE